MPSQAVGNFHRSSEPLGRPLRRLCAADARAVERTDRPAVRARSRFAQQSPRRCSLRTLDAGVDQTGLATFVRSADQPGLLVAGKEGGQNTPGSFAAIRGSLFGCQI